MLNPVLVVLLAGQMVHGQSQAVTIGGHLNVTNQAPAIQGTEKAHDYRFVGEPENRVLIQDGNDVIGHCRRLDYSLDNCTLSNGHDWQDLVRAAVAKGYVPLGLEKKELHCAQYEHVEHWPGNCGPAECDTTTGTCYASCTTPPPDKCVPDIHEVTEKEWQKMLYEQRMLRDIIIQNLINTQDLKKLIDKRKGGK